MRSLSLALIVALFVGPCVIATPVPPQNSQLTTSTGSGDQQNPPAGLSLPSESAPGNLDASSQGQGGQDTWGAPSNSNPSRRRKRKKPATEQIPEGEQGSSNAPSSQAKGKGKEKEPSTERGQRATTPKSQAGSEHSSKAGTDTTLGPDTFDINDIDRSRSGWARVRTKHYDKELYKKENPTRREKGLKMQKHPVYVLGFSKVSGKAYIAPMTNHYVHKANNRFVPEPSLKYLSGDKVNENSVIHVGVPFRMAPSKVHMLDESEHNYRMTKEQEDKFYEDMVENIRNPPVWLTTGPSTTTGGQDTDSGSQPLQNPTTGSSTTAGGQGADSGSQPLQNPTPGSSTSTVGQGTNSGSQPLQNPTRGGQQTGGGHDGGRGSPAAGTSGGQDTDSSSQPPQNPTRGDSRDSIPRGRGRQQTGGGRGRGRGTPAAATSGGGQGTDSGSQPPQNPSSAGSSTTTRGQGTDSGSQSSQNPTRGRGRQQTGRGRGRGRGSSPAGTYGGGQGTDSG